MAKRIPMVALKNFPFAGHNQRVGREFRAPTNEAARFLVAAKLADFAPADTVDETAPISPAQATATVALTRDVLAEAAVASEAEIRASIEAGPADDEPAAHDGAPTDASVPPTGADDPEASAPAGKPKRQYKRRDMQAEDSVR